MSKAAITAMIVEDSRLARLELNHIAQTSLLLALVLKKS